MRRTADILKRITGFSTPVFGLQWNAPASDRETVRKLLAFLEDRRALFNPLPAEVEDHVISSLHSIRMECASIVGALSEKAPAAVHVRAIGAACSRFLDEPYPTFDDIMERRRDPYFDREETSGRLRYGTNPASFFTALGELRAFVGTQIALLAVLYDVEVHGDLVRILPPILEDGV